MKRFVLSLILMVSGVIGMAAEDFHVVSFKRLDWDLDARVTHPKTDCNGKKAALIKVIASENSGFVFDVGIMGVVDQTDKPGETWLYVPEGIRRITVSHPDYGVIRDWPLGLAIESAVVYELRLHVPPRIERVVVERDTVVRDSLVYVPVVPDPVERGPLGISVIALASAPDMSFGAMVAWYSRLGCYAKFRSDFRPASWKYSCTSDGMSGDGYVWTSAGDDMVSRMQASAGAVYSFGQSAAVYIGGGYGRRVLLWQDSAGALVRVSDRSASGLALECGTIFRFGAFAVEFGIATTAFRHVDCEIGVGISF